MRGAEGRAGEFTGLVSVVVPAFNRPGMLIEAVESVTCQTYRPVEAILVDDGSTAETATLCDCLASDRPDLVRVLHRPNGGAGAARETGRLAARGEFVQYLDSDDLLLPKKLELQVEALRRCPDAGVAYGYTKFRRADGSEVEDPWKGSGAERETMFPWMLTERWWDTPTPLYRRSVCDAAGPWENLRVEEDWEYDCRVAALGARLVQVRDFVAVVRDHDLSRLSRGTARDRERMRDRARSHVLCLGHARRAGLGPESPFLARYARELFLLARQCGAAGLPGESRTLFSLAREASGEARGKGLDFRFYRALAGAVGWVGAGHLSCWSDRLRSGQAGAGSA